SRTPAPCSAICGLPAVAEQCAASSPRRSERRWRSPQSRPRWRPLAGQLHPPAVWLAAGVVGFLVPDFDLRRHLASRRTHIQMELPAILDQLAIATSAGLSLEQAFAEVAESSDGVVADELRRVMAELTYGRWDS